MFGAHQDVRRFSPGLRFPSPALGAGRSLTLPAVKMFRRVLLVLAVAGGVGAIARLRGKGELPATEGGWRELDGPDFR